MQKTILCLGHDGHRAGAELALLRILEWLSVNVNDLHPVVVLKRGGELVRAYRTLAPTYVLEEREENEQLYSTIHAADAVRHHEVDLIYVNTIAALDLADEFKKVFRCPVILQVRELEMGIRLFAGLELFRDSPRYVDAYASSTVVAAANLVKNYNIPQERVHRLPAGIPLSEAPRPSLEQQDEIRRSMGIPAGAFIVGGSGGLHWWKSPDVFLQVAREVRRAETDRQIHFLWVGGQLGSHEYDLLLHDILALDVDDRVHFVGAQTATRPYFSLLDVFLLTSREDSFPYVCLEVALDGVPTICFQGAGGAPEFVESDAGFVVPYLDTQTAAKRILSLVREPELRSRLGQRAAEKVRERHDLNETCWHLVRLVERHLDRAARNAGQ